MIADGVAVDELTAAHLQATGVSVDKRTGEVLRVDTVDLAVDEADLATAVDAGETDTMTAMQGTKEAAAGKLERAVLVGSTMMSPNICEFAKRVPECPCISTTCTRGCSSPRRHR